VVLPPLDVNYMADRLDIDDPLKGYMVSSPHHHPACNTIYNQAYIFCFIFVYLSAHICVYIYIYEHFITFTRDYTFISSEFQINSFALLFTKLILFLN
jgi:hypothetical protein